MKKLLTILLAALLILGAAACAKKDEPAAPASTGTELSQWKTLGDVWAFESPSYGCEESRYVRLFTVDGLFYRADAALTEEQFQQLMDIDIFDPEAEQKTKALVAELPIEHLYTLTDVLLSQAELDALKGKTGQELLDMGFVPQGSYGFSEAEKISWASLDKGPFEYKIDFVEQLTVKGDPNVAEVIRPLTVKAAAWEGGLSEYAMAADFDLHGGRSLADYEAMFEEPEQIFYSIPEIPLEDSPFKTLADVYAVLNQTNDEGGTPSYSSGVSETMYAAAFEKKNAAFLGRGVCYNKFTGSRGKSGSNDANAEYIGRLRKIMDDHDISWQTAELGKVDVGGGGTIAYICALYGMEVIDSGVAVLSMHAPEEVISKADLYEAIRAYAAFLTDMTKA